MNDKTTETTPDSRLEHYFLRLSRAKKRLIIMSVDFIAMVVALWAGYAMRLAEWWPAEFLQAGWWLFIAVPVTGLIIFSRLGLYRAVVRYMGAQLVWTIFNGVAALAVLIWASAFVFEIRPFSRSVPFNFALVTMLLMGGSRFVVRSLYHWLLHKHLDKRSVLIYGAGGAGVQLSTALANSRELSCVGFIDDNSTLWGSVVSGLKVYSPDEIGKLIKRLRVEYVVLAMPTITASRRRHILENLVDYPVHVQTVPAMHEIVSGESLTSLREIEVEELLGRDVVPAQKELINASIKNKVVMVTGAGGSIGSELCRQVLMNQPRALVMLERSEFALYEIEMELKALMAEKDIKVPCRALLGSVNDAGRIDSIIAHCGVQSIYHAAAYKHVPLVEHNILEGVRNNALGTRVVAEAAIRHQVERFILVSTDKAVRPANVMGATKRLAELILQDMALASSDTVFSMVRFGNVLGSSGSVVPLFRKQIEADGPVTVTHPDITRYFMTIPEAASLVIQAGSMAQGGDVFVLDMGEPVKIVDLAKRMIRLMGLHEKTPESPEGDIEIQFTGLRPGEKLFEELLVGEEVVGTQHPKIMRALEECLDADVLRELTEKIQAAIDAHDCEKLYALLRKAVGDFTPSSPMADLLTNAKKQPDNSSLILDTPFRRL